MSDDYSDFFGSSVVRPRAKPLSTPAKALSAFDYDQILNIYHDLRKMFFFRIRAHSQASSKET
jgi:hypothetical protein